MKNKINSRFVGWLLFCLMLLVVAPKVAAQNGWTNAAPLTSARYGMATGVIDGKIYVAGGIIPGVAFLTTVEVYDPAMNTWSTLASMPAARYTAFAEVISGKLYVAGGYDGSSTVATLFVYDPATNTWSTLAPMATPRALLTGGVIDGKLYVAGGYTSTTTFASVNNLEVYDPATNTWATKTPMPNSGRYGAGGAVFTNKLYVAGGYGNDVGYTNILEVYDPLTDSWTAKASMPQIQYLLAAGALEGQLYAVGGQDGTNPIKLMQVYDPTTNTWSMAPVMPTARLALSAEVVGNSIYVMGGHNGTAEVAMHEVFTPPTCGATLAGLVGWWAGDGDARGNTGANNGTLNLQSGHSGIGVGHVGQSFMLNGSEYIGVPDDDSLEMTSQFTLAAWINPKDVNNHRKVISKFGTLGNYGYEFGLGLTGSLRADISGTGNTYGSLISPNNLVTIDAWQHIAFTFNAGNLSIFLNGVEVASSTSSITSIYSNGTAPFSIGRSSDGSGQFFWGMIDEAMVFNRALSAAEINDILAAGKKGGCKSAPTASGTNSQSVVGDQTVTFQNVTTPGVTTTNGIAPLSAGDLPAGFTHTGLAYDISTTASFTGPVQICFNLPSLINPASGTDLRVLHLENGTLVDRTTGRGANSSMLCSSVSSLSPFVIAHRASAPTAAPATISGQITTTNGQPLGGVVLTLAGGTELRRAITDANGRYSFAAVETSQFYTVTPERANYQFTPAERSFSLVANMTEAVFTADATPVITGNPLDAAEFFVRQHYLDFLNREPDAAGLAFWSDQIRECDLRVLAERGSCREAKLINVSAAFFLSIEFQETGYLAYRLERTSFARLPRYVAFMHDAQTIGQSVIVGEANWQAKLETNKQTFIAEWIARPAFRELFDSKTNEEYVDALISNSGVASSSFERATLVAGLNGGTESRATVLRKVAENSAVTRRHSNPAFVYMQYAGYLRRNPDDAPDGDLSGFDFWLRKLNEHHGDYAAAEMVKSFLISAEYRNRF